MTDPEETLSAIDAAIEGWAGYDSTVSNDAMRWAPEAPETEWRGAETSMTFVDEVRHWGTTGRIFAAPPGTVFMNAPDGTWTNIGYTTEDGFELGDPDGVGERPLEWPNRPVPQTFTLTPDQVEVFRHFADYVQRQHDALRRAFQGVTKGLSKMADHMHAATAPTTYGDDYRKHRRRCRICNPAGNPGRLTVNGREYARRRKNRRRRGLLV